MRAELTVEIARPPEEVFAYLTDVSHLPEWQAGVLFAQREGDRIRESRTLFGRELHSTLEVVENDPPSCFALRALDGPLRFTVRHLLEPSGGGTSLNVVAEADAGLLPGFASGLVARRAEKQFRGDFERLKELLESSPPRRPPGRSTSRDGR